MPNARITSATDGLSERWENLRTAKLNNLINASNLAQKQQELKSNMQQDALFQKLMMNGDPESEAPAPPTPTAGSVSAGGQTLYEDGYSGLPIGDIKTLEQESKENIMQAKRLQAQANKMMVLPKYREFANSLMERANTLRDKGLDNLDKTIGHKKDAMKWTTGVVGQAEDQASLDLANQQLLSAGFKPESLGMPVMWDANAPKAIERAQKMLMSAEDNLKMKGEFLKNEKSAADTKKVAVDEKKVEQETRTDEARRQLLVQQTATSKEQAATIKDKRDNPDKYKKASGAAAAKLQAKKDELNDDYTYIAASIDDAISQIRKNPKVVGGIGYGSRALEFVESSLNSNAKTPASDFKGSISKLQSDYATSMFGGKSKRFKTDVTREQAIITGLGAMTSAPQAIHELEQLKATIARRAKVLTAEEEDQAAPDDAPPEGFEIVEP